jgi:hypothetical protein
VRICDFSKEPGAIEPSAVSLSRIYGGWWRAFSGER